MESTPELLPTPLLSGDEEYDVKYAVPGITVATTSFNQIPDTQMLRISSKDKGTTARSSASFHSDICPNCKENVRLERVHMPDARTWVLCGALCNLGCWLGICLFPLCSEAFHYPRYFCTECKKII
jgi:hypothetical protein